MEEYQQEKRLQEKLKEELLFLTQKNLRTAIKKFESLVEQALKFRYDKKLKITQEFREKNQDDEELRMKAKEEFQEEINKLNKMSVDIQSNIKKELESVYNNNFKQLEKGIDELMDISNINKNIKYIYNSIQKDENTSNNINNKLNECLKNYQDKFRNYLLKKMQYKEELEIYNIRQKQINEENIDIKQDYMDMNEYLSHYKIDIQENQNIKNLDNLIETIDKFDTNQ